MAVPATAMILTAGLGTRLMPLTLVRAKPAVPVAGEPIVRRVARWLADAGVTELVLNLHHRPESIARVMGDGRDLGVTVRYSWEQPRVLGSAGGVRQALDLLGAEPFLIVNGDTLTDVDLAAMAAAHRSSSALVTLALTAHRAPHKYGGVTLDSQASVTGFTNPGPTAADAFHFAGVQIASPEVFRAVPVGQPAKTVRGIYDQLFARQPGAVRGWVTRATFWDIGTVDDYLATSGALAGGSTFGARVHIDASARMSSCIVWDDVDVAAGCVLSDCIVTDRVRVPAGARYDGAILLAGPDGDISVHPLPARQ